MSTKVLDLAWDADLPLARKMVLVALADQANDHGESYPGLASMQRRCSMSRSTLYAALADLESEDWLTRETIGGGHRTLYRLNLAKLQQRSLLGPSPGPSASRTVRQPDRPAAGSSGSGKQGGPGAGLHKSNQQQEQPEGGRTRAEQLEVMGSYDRSVIQPYLGNLPPSIELQVFADFVKHRQVKGAHLSIPSWMQVLQTLKQLEASGVDLNESLRRTVALGAPLLPVDPRPKSSRGGPPRTRPDDFTNARYEGTPDDQLPDFLRASEPADA